MRRTTGVTAGLLGVAAALAVGTGCGVQSDDPGPDRTTAVTSSTTTKTTTVKAPLPKRSDGVVAITFGPDNTGEGVRQSLATAYAAQSGKTIRATRKSEAAGFDDLCRGNVDFITTTREPTTQELALCNQTGVKLAAPIQLASEAIVLATKNSSDVGGDCITVRQARDIFKAGSQYTNWNQLGFDDLPLRTTGREGGSQNFRLFGQIVLGEPEPTIGDVRADYRARLSDRSQRETVTGARVIALARKRIADYRKRLVAQTKQAHDRYVGQAIIAASKRAVKVIDQVNAENRRKKINVDAAKLIAFNKRFVARVQAAAAIRASRVFNARINRQVAAYQRRALNGLGQRGFIGPFRYSYYGLFEDQLRPMEIDFGVPETLSGQPVQLQDLTAADQAAVTKDILSSAANTNAAQAATAGVTAATTTTTTSAGTTTTTSTTATVRRPVTLPPTTVVPPLDNLPAKTKNGDIIYPGPNCVFPSQLTITNGAYPLTRRTFVYTSEQALKRPDVVATLTWLVQNIQRLANNLQLIPITDFQASEDLAIIRRQPAPKPAKVNTGEAVITTTTSTTTATGTSTGTSTTGTTTTGTSTTATTPSVTATPPSGAAPTIAPPSTSGIPGVSNRRVSSGQ